MLILIVLAWIFFVLGSIMNFRVWRLSLKAKEGDRVPSGIPFIPGLAGSLAVFFTLPRLAQWGLVAPWPLLWIVLPLFLDVCCLGGFVLALLGFAKKEKGVS